MSLPSLRQTFLVALAVGNAVAANAQQTTERYIPIGASPGVSGEHSYLGEIIAVDTYVRTLTVRDASGTHTIRVTEGTRIWLDRSRSQRTTLDGNFEDCEVGDRVEIMRARDDEMIAEWIKVEAL